MAKVGGDTGEIFLNIRTCVCIMYARGVSFYGFPPRISLSQLESRRCARQVDGSF